MCYDFSLPAHALKPACACKQTVKARVLTADAAARKLRLSLAPKSGAEGGSGAAGADALGGLQPGDIVEGTVRSIAMQEVRLHLLPSTLGYCPWLHAHRHACCLHAANVSLY